MRIRELAETDFRGAKRPAVRADGRPAIRVEHEPTRKDGTLLLPATWVEKAAAKGYVTLVNARQVTRPGGPPDNPWLGAIVVTPDGIERRNHVFTHADQIVLHTVDGDVLYDVIDQPDKYAARDGDDSATKVDDARYAAGETDVRGRFVVRRAEV